MRARSWFAILVVIIVAAFTIAVQAEAETWKGRTSVHMIKVESIQVGDVPGHVLFLGENGGLVFWENGQVATASSKFTGEYTKGSGTWQSYVLWTFEDESTIVSKWLGSTTADPGGKVSWFKGTYSTLQGTGRFAGIEGNGSFTGKRVAPLSMGADSYYDFTMIFTLPPR